MKTRQALRQLASVAAIVIGLITATTSHGAIDTQTSSAATTVTAGGTWTNPANAATINGSCALGDGSTSTSLTITGWNFAIPAGSTILGITVRSVSSFNDASTQDQIRLTKAGSPVGTAKVLNGPGTRAIPSCVSPIPDSNGLTVGGNSDLWGTTWTADQINASGFGVFYDNNFSNTAVDGVEITIMFDDGVYFPSKIGVFRSGVWYLDMNGNRIWNGPVTDAAVQFGIEGDIPVAGNWNGFPGSFGVFRAGKWYLDWNGSDQWEGPASDAAYSFGLAGDLPVAGDWDGDGLTEIGVFRNGSWYLDYNGNGIWEGPPIDRMFTFGLTGDIPVAGDWSGTNAHDCPGVFRAVGSQGKFYLDWNCNNVWDGPITDRAYTFGIAGDLPVVGDWNGDGQTKIGVFRNGKFYLDLNGNGIWNGCNFPYPADGCFTFGLATDKPVVGNW